MKDQNTQTEIVQINDQPVQAESTTQQQGIKTASVAVLILHNILSAACINTWSFFEEQESMCDLH